LYLLVSLTDRQVTRKCLVVHGTHRAKGFSEDPSWKALRHFPSCPCSPQFREVAFCEDGNVAVGKLSGALAYNLGERRRRADNVGVGDDVEQGDSVGG
jgi:hypothetical protein